MINKIYYRLLANELFVFLLNRCREFNYLFVGILKKYVNPQESK